MSSPAFISTREKQLADRKTDWRSVKVVTILLGLLGLQLSIYFTSTWQYLSENDETATVDFFGAILAAQALAGAFGNPLFGWWNQVSNSTRKPVMTAFVIASIGNVLYSFLYLFPPYSKFIMLFSRILIGAGSGALGCLRCFVATASTKSDRMKAVSLSNTGFTVGFFLGPTLQICFIPLGNVGVKMGFVHFNMYTSCAMLMTILSFFSVFLIFCLLEENYVGIFSNQEKDDDPFFVLPKFDRIPVLFLFFTWWLTLGVVCVESMASPITMAMFNWNREDAVLYNGLIQTVSCLITISINFSLASTRLRNCDIRILLLIGFLFFESFFILHLPWPFYDGPLDRPVHQNSTDIISNIGGCDFDWCDYTPRVPLYLYLFIASVLLGLGFPLISSSSSNLLSQILGPRKQGVAQGFHAFTGSFSQFCVSLMSTQLFESSGYKWIMVYHLCVISFAILMCALLWRRLIPLKITPSNGIATRYKSGTFYRM